MSGRLRDSWKDRFWWRGRFFFFSIARIACWWTVSPASLLLAPPSRLLFLSTSCTVAAGNRSAVARCGEVDSERKRKGEREDWQGPGGQLERMCFCFPLRICIDKMFFPSVWLFIFLSLSFLLWTLHRFIYSIIFIFYMPLLLLLFLFLRITSTSFSFLLTLFSFYSQLPFFLSTTYLQIYLPSPSLLLWACWTVHFTYMLHCNILEVEAYSHRTCTSETMQSLQPSPFISHPPSLAPMNVFN